MCGAYIAAGLSAERFWGLTPRLYLTEMEGARMRIKRERALVWSGAMLARVEKPPTLAQFLEDAPEKEPAEFLDMRLRASTTGLRAISMAEYRRAVRGR